VAGSQIDAGLLRIVTSKFDEQVMKVFLNTSKHIDGLQLIMSGFQSRSAGATILPFDFAV
jgi:hypothetical protein